MASAGKAVVPEDGRQRNAAEVVQLAHLDRNGRPSHIFLPASSFLVGVVLLNLVTKGPTAYFEHLELPKQLCMNSATSYSELIDWILSHVTDADMFIVQSAVTCGALCWCVYLLSAPTEICMLTELFRLLHRAWLTLWKPVPELINTLGVEVPEAPAVSLAGIKADAITLQWTRPGVNKPVNKYLIQVNGVNGKGA